MRNNSIKLNECVVQFLYGYDITGTLIEASDLKFSMKVLLMSKTKVLEAHQLTKEIIEQVSILNNEIENISQSYELDRVSKLDLAILRWAFFLYNNKRFEKTANLINEAIRLSKKFSTVEASKFIHAILDEKVKIETIETIETAETSIA